MQRAAGGRGNERESGLEWVLYWTDVQLVFLKKRIWSEDRGLLSALEVISPVQDHILHLSLSLSLTCQPTLAETLCSDGWCLLCCPSVLSSTVFWSSCFFFYPFLSSLCLSLPPLFPSSSHLCIPRQCCFMMAEQSSLVHAVYIIHHEARIIGNDSFCKT